MPNSLKPRTRRIFNTLIAVMSLAGNTGIALPESTVHIYQTTRQGDRLKEIDPEIDPSVTDYSLRLNPEETFQTLIGVGGSFTESAAQVLSELSATQREIALRLYFSPSGAQYSLTRTPIASCDFSLNHYTYAPVPDDTALAHFSIAPDRTYLLPMIQEAQKIPGASFKILASPWTAPPWMKTNQTWNGGKLLPEHYPTFARYIVRYLQTYRKEGIPIWGITPTNEPMGNDSNWESLHFTASEMADWIANHLGPALEAGAPGTRIWAYDQNRGQHLEEWADTLYANPQAAQYVDGMAVHWYESTLSIGAESLDAVHTRHPGKGLLHSEGCIDAIGDDEEIGSWLEDDWYWRKEATDWGYIWAPEDQKANHPAYRPFYRYARNLIGGLNHNLVGWIDWNLFLNTRGGPNHARNFCLAPILVDSGRDSLYITPLYYAIAHVSKYIRPGAVRIGLHGHDDDLMATAFRNPDGSIALVAFNGLEEEITYEILLGSETIPLRIPGQALQTIRISTP
ncbi:MAG: glycoside hydrolase family 30 protein [Puniceicoccales bacterium]